MRRHRLVVGLVAAALSGPALAVPITYNFFGIASGSVGGSVFADAPISFSLTTDTDGVFRPFPNRPNIFATANAPIDFTFGGTAGTFDGGGNVFVSGGRGARSAVGLNPESGSDLFDVSDLSLETYDLRSAFGPLAAEFPSFLNFGEVFATSAGDFVLSDDDDTRLGFRANLVGAGVVPEPAAWTLMISGFAIVGAARRRARRLPLSTV